MSSVIYSLQMYVQMGSRRNKYIVGTVYLQNVIQKSCASDCPIYLRKKKSLHFLLEFHLISASLVVTPTNFAFY